MTFAGNFRRAAQYVRHLPLVKNSNFLWNFIRPLYKSVLNVTATRGVQVTVGGTTVFVDPAFATTSFETIEAASYAIVKQILKPGDVFFDVGAAIGCYTMVASSCIGPTGKILAFEPDPEARVFLRRHLDWNGIAERVTIREVCCSKESGERELYVSPKDVGGQASLFPQPGFEKIVVVSTSLDEEWIRDGLRPALVKIDVEGAEWDVLQGAQRLLEEVRPTLLLSIHPTILESRGITESQVLDWLQQKRYHCSVLERDHEVHIVAKPLV